MSECPYCGSTKNVKDYHKWMYPHALTYDVRQCTECGMVFKAEETEEADTQS